MSTDAKFNTDPNWDGKLTLAIDGGLHQLASDFQSAIDGLRPAYEGKPVEQIKPALERAWAEVNNGPRIIDPHLTQYAEAIRVGRPMEIRYDGITH
jgi:hypothetical protein